MTRGWLLLGCLLLGGCLLQNAGAGKRLTDTVNEMDKTTRWGQVADAARLAVPAYRAQFMARHSDWGQEIQLGDSEVVHVEMAPDSESAVALLSYSWYLTDAMTLHQSVVRQHWVRGRGGDYALLSEAIVQGDPRLFHIKGPVPGASAAQPESLGLAD